MLNRVVKRQGEEGVTSWIRFAAIIGIVSLMLTMLSFSPTQARAEEQSDSTTTVEDTTTVSNSIEDADEPLDPTSELPNAEEPDSLDAGLQSLGELVAPLAVNEDIDVEVKSIIAEGKTADDQISVGDSVVVSGTWDSAFSDPAEGTQFWVTFPNILEDLEIESPIFGGKLLLAKNDSVIGVEVDTETAGELGEWEVSATVSEATDAQALNFRTSADHDLDVPVELPGEEGISAAAKAASFSTRSISGGSTNADGITVDILNIENADSAGNKLQPGQSAKINGTWAAADGAQAGDSFKVSLPSVFGITPIADFDLLGSDGASYGICTVSVAESALNCVLSDEVEGKTDARGEWNLYVEAIGKTADETVTFEIEGGDPIVVELPGENGGIGEIIPLPTDVTKSGSRGSDQRTITWTVDLPGQFLIENNEPNPVTFQDTPAGNQRIVAGSGKVVYWENPDNKNANIALPGSAVTLGAQNAANTFDLTIDPGEAWDPFKVYRVTYQTKTDGLTAPGEAFTNSIGIGAGVGIEGSVGGPVWKSGGFTDNTREIIEWKLFAPGSARNGNEIVITDELIAGEHEVTTNSVTSLRVNKNGEDVSNATLTRIDNKNLTITIPAADAVDTDVYEIWYRTYYSGTPTHPVGSLPEGQTQFKNEANVGDTTVRATVTTPGFQSSKNGWLNAEPTTIGGVEHSANSTLNWELKVSGNRVDLTGLSPVIVTDTITGAHQVCEGTAPLAERLNASLQVWDWAENKSVTDHGVTLTVEAGDEEGQVKYVLNPGAQGFSRNHEFNIKYTTCTISGGQDEFGTTYGNSAEGSGISVNKSVELRAGGGGTGTGVAKGSFALTKVASSESEPFSRNYEFTVLAEEFAPSGLDANGHPVGTPANSYEITVKADGTPVSGFTSRGNGWKIRLTEIGVPQGVGLDWAPGIFRTSEGVEVLDEGRTALVSITPRSNVGVVLENTARLGGATIAKTVTGLGASSLTGAERFQVTAFFDFDADGIIDDSESFMLVNGGAKQLKDLPIGTIVTFEETQPADTDAHTWGTPVFAPERLVIGADTAANAVTLTNTVSVTEGTFALKKVLEGTEADNANVPNDFLITATWDGGSEEIIIPANGTVIPFGQHLPAGTEVTLTEAVPADGNNLAWADAAFTGEGIEIIDGNAVVTIGRGNTEITVTNTVVEMGTLQIIKTISGEAAEDIAADAAFQVLAQWKTDPTASEYTEKTLTLSPGVAVELGVDLPSGTEVRLTEIGTADINGISWGEVNWTGNGSWITTAGGSATVIVSDDPAEGRLVTLDNEAAWADRPVTIEKKIIGETQDRVGDEQSFTVEAFFPATSENKTYTVTRDQVTDLGSFPVGTEIVFTEVQPTNTDQVTWGAPVFSPEVLVVGAEDGANIVTLTNEASITEGTFNLHKVIEGTEADNANLPGDYTITAEWLDAEGEAQTKDIVLSKDGGVIPFGENLEAGTEVTLTEAVPADGNNLTWAQAAFTGEGITIVDGQAVLTIGDGDAAITVTNTVVEMGTLQIVKMISGAAADFISTNDEFTILAEWKTEDSEDFQSKELTLKSDGVAVSLGEDLPVGTEVRFTEIGTPAIDGVAWGTATWTGGSWLSVNGQTAVGIVSDDPSEGRLITLNNEAGYAARPVVINKLVEGDAAGLVTANNYVVSATFPATGEVRNFTINAGTPAIIGSYPVGTVIEFTEVQPENTDQVTWGEPIFEPGNRIEIGANDLNVSVSLKNTANHTYGTFSVAKNVIGPEQYNPNVPESFEVLAQWANEEGVAQEKTLTVPTNGVVEFDEDLKNGTQVTLTEIVPADGEGIAWGIPAFSGDVTVDGGSNIVTIAKDAQNVTMTNYADTNTGTLRWSKAVSGEAAEAVGDDVKFTVEARWNDGSTYQTRVLTFGQGETIDLGEELPVGTEVTFAEIKLPEIAGVVWGSITWGTNPNGEQWLHTNADGTVSGIISDNPLEGRLVTLTNEALWLPGSVSYEKYIFDGETPVPATEADLPEGAEFQVEIESIELPAGKELSVDAGIAQGDIITLNAENNFYWESDKALPKGTIITFGELDPAPLPGMDWGLPFYYVSADAGEAGDRNVLEITPDGEAKVEIRNRPIPTTEVEIEKTVTGPKGSEITNDDATLFQVTASWTDIDGINRECILDVVPGESAVPTADCNATVVDGKVQFPLNTDITFTETGAYTDVSNVKWSDVIWTINGGAGETEAVEGEQTSATVTLTGDSAAPVSLGLENKTSSNGMIIIPIPLPIPPLPGGSSTPPSPTTPPESVTPNRPEAPEPTTPPESVTPGRPGSPEPAGPNESVSLASPQKGGGLASTGANVAWIAGGAVLLLAGGTWLLIRGRKNGTSS